MQFDGVKHRSLPLTRSMVALVLMGTTACQESTRTPGPSGSNSSRDAAPFIPTPDARPPTLDSGNSGKADARSGAIDSGLANNDAGDTTTDSGPSHPDASSAQTDLPSGVTMLSFDEVIDGQTVSRPVTVHAPRTVDRNANYPVVFALHGNGGRAQQFVQRMRN